MNYILYYDTRVQLSCALPSVGIKTTYMQDQCKNSFQKGETLG